MALSRNHGLPSQNLRARQGIPPIKLFIREIQETPKTTYIVFLSLGCLTEHEDKTLLLKILHSLVTRFGEINLVVTWITFQRTTSQKVQRCYASCQG